MAPEARHEPDGGDRILAIADRLAAQDEDAAAEREQRAGWISFAVAAGDEVFALPVTHVRGVHRAGRITPLPRTPDTLRGLTNLRGRVIAVVDLAVRLGLAPTAVDERSRILEAEIGHRRLGLLVARTEQLLRVRPSDVEPLAAGAEADATTRCAAGAVATRTGRVVLLDPELTLEGAEAAPRGGAAEARRER